MKPVTQSRTGEDGTCFRACIASILEVPESRVPDFGAFGNDDCWWDDIQTWLGKAGLEYRRLPVGSGKPTGYSTIEGISPRGGLHACVAYDGELVHDPHPQDGTGRGLVEPRYYGVFEPVRISGGDWTPYDEHPSRTGDRNAFAEKAAAYRIYKGTKFTDRDMYVVLRSDGSRVGAYAMKKDAIAAKRADLNRKATDRADMLALRSNTEQQGGPFFIQETTKNGTERTIPVKKLSKAVQIKTTVLC